MVRIVRLPGWVQTRLLITALVSGVGLLVLGVLTLRLNSRPMGVFSGVLGLVAAAGVPLFFLRVRASSVEVGDLVVTVRRPIGKSAELPRSAVGGAYVTEQGKASRARLTPNLSLVGGDCYPLSFWSTTSRKAAAETAAALRAVLAPQVGDPDGVGR